MAQWQKHISEKFGQRQQKAEKLVLKINSWGNIVTFQVYWQKVSNMIGYIFLKKAS